MALNPAFWQGRRVLLTGHTGFKGGWLALWLRELGAEVFGYALEASTTPSLWQAARLAERVPGRIADIRDAEALSRDLLAFRPEIVLHREDSDLLVVAEQASQRKTHQIEFTGRSEGHPPKTTTLELTVVDSK